MRFKIGDRVVTKQPGTNYQGNMIPVGTPGTIRQKNYDNDGFYIDMEGYGEALSLFNEMDAYFDLLPTGVPVPKALRGWFNETGKFLQGGSR